jgi:hypothetical protein
MRSMSEALVTVLTSKISEERLLVIVNKRPLLSFRRPKATVIARAKVHHPYWCVALESTARQKVAKNKTLKLLVTVDAVTGDAGLAKSIPEGSEVSEETVQGRLEMYTNQGEAWKKAEDVALGIFMKKIFFLEGVSSEIKYTRLIYYPYWVVTIQKENGETFRKAIDAIHGEPNHKLLYLLDREQ